MAWRIVKQPNGLLARFSDIVDNFTDLNMTEPEAVALCSNTHNMAMPDAMKKVLAGVEDWKPWTIGEKGHGLSRWQDSLKTIKVVHGNKAVQNILELLETAKTNQQHPEEPVSNLQYPTRREQQ